MVKPWPGLQEMINEWTMIIFSELVNKRQARGALLLRWTVENLTDQDLFSFVFLVVLARWKLKRKWVWQKLSSRHTLCSMKRNAFKTLLAYNLLETWCRCSKMQKSLWMNQENYNKVAAEVSSNNTIIVFLNFVYLCWVCWLFIAVQACLSLRCLGSSLQRLHLLWRARGLRQLPRVGSVEHRLSSCNTRA